MRAQVLSQARDLAPDEDIRASVNSRVLTRQRIISELRVLAGRCEVCMA